MFDIDHNVWRECKPYSIIASLFDIKHYTSYCSGNKGGETNLDKLKDRRVQRTRAMLHEAILDLMVVKGYEAITVQDLIDRANIGRATFYYHYVDKEALLIESINQLRTFLKEQITKSVKSEETEEFQFRFSLAFLQHVQGHKQIYSATVDKQSGALVLHYMKQIITDIAKEEIELWIPNSGSSLIPQDVAVEFAVNTLFTLIAWWMHRNKQYTAIDVDRMFHQLTLSGIGPDKNVTQYNIL
ncbi:MAG: TetR/AcrR family transcriptional regulator [Bacilli bacterium]